MHINIYMNINNICWNIGKDICIFKSRWGCPQIHAFPSNMIAFSPFWHVDGTISNYQRLGRAYLDAPCGSSLNSKLTGATASFSKDFNEASKFSSLTMQCGGTPSLFIPMDNLTPAAMAMAILILVLVSFPNTPSTWNHLLKYMDWLSTKLSYQNHDCSHMNHHQDPRCYPCVYPRTTAYQLPSYGYRLQAAADYVYVHQPLLTHHYMYIAFQGWLSNQCFTIAHGDDHLANGCCITNGY